MKRILIILALFSLILPHISMAQGYERIISLYPAHTENLVSLSAIDKLIGISRSDSYPENILTKPRFSYRDDPEKFIAANPDLVLIRPMIEHAYPQFVEKLQKAGIKVISLQPKTMNDTYLYWQKLAHLVDAPKAGDKMVQTFQQGLKHYQEKLTNIPESQRPKVYFESIHRRMKTFTEGSIALFALEQAGGINVAQGFQVRNTNIADYGKERILSHAAEIDVFLAQKGRMNPVTPKTIKDEPGFGAIKAIENGKIYLIEEELVSRPTLRILTGIEQIHNILYEEQ